MRNPIALALLSLIILAYPLFYSVPYIFEQVGYLFEGIYFVSLNYVFLIVVLALLTIRRGHIAEPAHRRDLLVLLAMTLLVAASTRGTDQLNPLSFFVFALTFFYLVSSSGLAMVRERVVFAVLFCAYVLLSGVFYFQGTRVDLGRFTGFAISATTYSIFMAGALVAALYTIDNPLLRVGAYLAALPFIWISQTRSTLVFALALPFLMYLVRRLWRFRLAVFLAAGLVIHLGYPLLEMLAARQSDDLVAARYEGGMDTSLMVRRVLFDMLSDELASGTPEEIALGRSAEHSRQLVKREIGFDLLPHHDLLRLLVDFGVLGTLIYIAFVYRIASRNRAAFVMSLLYMVSFYHNMIYSRFLMGLILLFGLTWEGEVESPAEVEEPVEDVAVQGAAA